ncbi:MAG: hypothetical protein IID45_03845 [Planctomycetes bacterium]|nr:hypothetical protein [Planctomycetota bacterium]
MVRLFLRTIFPYRFTAIVAGEGTKTPQRDDKKRNRKQKKGQTAFFHEGPHESPRRGSMPIRWKVTKTHD